jgi:hypothetical protein
MPLSTFNNGEANSSVRTKINASINEINSFFLISESTNILGLRNSTNAQNFRIYNTYTDGSNYERGVFGFTSNVLRIGTEKGGTGVARAMSFLTDGVERINIGTTGIISLYPEGLTTLTFYNIGGIPWIQGSSIQISPSPYSSGIVVRNGMLDLQPGVSLRFDYRGYILPISDGVMAITDIAGTNFNRLQFGGTTSSFPALKRSGTSLHARLADDSGFTSVTVKNLVVDGGYTNGAWDGLTLNGFKLRSYINAGSGIFLESGNFVAPAIGIGLGSPSDTVFLNIGATDTLYQVRGTNAQKFWLANTYTDANNYERAVFGFTSNVLRIGTEQLGTGVARGIDFVVGGTTRFSITTDGTVSSTTKFKISPETAAGANSFFFDQGNGMRFLAFNNALSVSQDLFIEGARIYLNKGQYGVNRSIIAGTSVATTATNGFLYIPTCAGTPTGTPTAESGTAPIVIDSTNNKMYIYSGSTWIALN